MSNQPAASLTFSVQRYQNCVVVHCAGRLVSGLNQLLNAEVSKLLPGPANIVLDFEHVTHMDSSGLGTLVRLYVHAKSAGCKLEVDNMGPSIRNLLGITHLLSTLETVGRNNIKMG
ncbi:MAG TPA: STAS domain-containing protein [Terriglobales bacterium]|nr:STAS domain-containing protein [Terriglobales bacterium]